MKKDITFIVATAFLGVSTIDASFSIAKYFEARKRRKTEEKRYQAFCDELEAKKKEEENRHEEAMAKILNQSKSRERDEELDRKRQERLDRMMESHYKVMEKLNELDSTSP